MSNDTSTFGSLSLSTLLFFSDGDVEDVVVEDGGRFGQKAAVEKRVWSEEIVWHYFDETKEAYLGLKKPIIAIVGKSNSWLLSCLSLSLFLDPSLTLFLEFGCNESSFSYFLWDVKINDWWYLTSSSCMFELRDVMKLWHDQLFWKFSCCLK